jgi:hypothetical protein
MINKLHEYILSISGLQIWLDSTRFNGEGIANPANNSSVNSWADVSGNGKVVDQRMIKSPSPLTYTVDINNIPLLYSNGGTGKALFCDMRGAIGVDYTEFIILQGSITTSTMGQAQFATFLGNNGSGGHSIKTYGNPNYQEQGGAYGQAWTRYPGNAAIVSAISVLKNSQYHRVYNNLHKVYDFTSSSVIPKPNNNNHGDIIAFCGLPNYLGVGNGNNYGTGWYTTFNTTQSAIYEYAYWNRVLNASEIGRVQSYIKTKYSI